MTGILLQQEFYPGSLASTGAGSRIPPMAKKGQAYTREKARAVVAPTAKTHFIRQFRERENWSQEVLAEKSGLSLSSISAYERGDTDPSLEALQKLADAFGVPRGMLLDVNPLEDPPLWASVLKATTTRPAASKPKK